MMDNARKEDFTITSDCLKEEILAKNNLKKWLDTKKKEHNNGLNILLENHPVFKLKKKKIKNKKHRLVKNTKKYIFFIRGLVPVSTGFRNSNDDSKDAGFSWCVDVKFDWCADAAFTAKALKKRDGVVKK